MKCLVCGEVRRATGASYITSGLAFHRFPSNDNRMREWFQCIGKPINLAITLNDGVCSKHFRDSDYHVLPKLTVDMDHTQKKKIPILKPTAKPTLEEIFERNWSSKRPRSPSEKQQLMDSGPSSTTQFSILDSESQMDSESQIHTESYDLVFEVPENAGVLQITGQFHPAMPLNTMEEVELGSDMHKTKLETRHEFCQTLPVNLNNDYVKNFKERGVQCQRKRKFASPNVIPVYKDDTYMYEEDYFEETNNADSDFSVEPEATFTSTKDFDE